MAQDGATEKAGRDLLYERVADRLRRDIVAGFYPRGTFLPSEADLCDRFGVSRGTLRRALADLARLGLVLSRPGVGHRVAGRLTSGEDTENDLVAVLAPYAEGGPYFPEMVGGLERRLADASLHLIVCSTDERNRMTSEQVLATQVERLLEMRPRAVVISMETEAGHAEHLRAFSRMSIPVFQVGQRPQEPFAGFVGYDERLGSLMVADWLVRWSAGAVALVVGQSCPGLERRLEGWRIALAGHGLAAGEAGEIRLEMSEDTRALDEELRAFGQWERVGLFCLAEDHLPTLSAMIEEAGMDVGEQVAVGCVGCPAWRRPSVSMPLVAAQWSAAEMGEIAGDLIAHWFMQEGSRAPEQRLAAPRLAVDPAYGGLGAPRGTTRADTRR